ncbi:MAG: hypothetical protein WD512_09655 [Candidatus Paceibacterota bacterium]
MNLTGLLNECMMNKYDLLPQNYHYSSQKIITELKQFRLNWMTGIIKVNSEYYDKIFCFSSGVHEYNKFNPNLYHIQSSSQINYRNLTLRPYFYSTDFPIMKFTKKFGDPSQYIVKKVTLPENYVYTNTKEHLADFYKDRMKMNKLQLQQFRLKWITGIKKVNSEFRRKFTYHETYENNNKNTQYIVYKRNRNAINDRLLKVNKHTGIRNFMNGNVIEKIPKNYIYSCTKKQLYKLCHDPYNILSTYNIDF